MRRDHRVDHYFAGLLNARERAAFEKHLPSCAACRRDLATLEDLHAQLARDLPRTLPGRAPRQEWLAQLRSSLHTGERLSRRWTFVGLASAGGALATLAFLLVLARPWAVKLTPEQTLVRAYQATLQRTFSGTIEVRVGAATLLAGTFEHTPGDRWMIRFQAASGETVEERQAGNQIWQRQGSAPWTLVPAEPMLVLPSNAAAIDRVPTLLESIKMLSTVEAIGGNRYVSKDGLQMAQTPVWLSSTDSRGTGSAYQPSPQRIETTISTEGTISRVRFSMNTSVGTVPVVVDLVVGQYGVQLDIEPPLP